MLWLLACLPVASFDLVIEHARIWTDGSFVAGDTVGVTAGKFTYVGPSRPGLIGPKTVRIDAHGRVVIPGIIDSHTHMLESGVELTQLQLREATSMSDFARRVADYSKKLPSNKWVLGSGWSAESWPEKTQPTKATIDAGTGSHPAMLSRMDGHSALVNSVALKLAKIDKNGPPNPPGGVIDRDPVTNEPTGMLRETAVGLVARFVPNDTADDMLAGLKLAAKEANRHGVTAVSDISSVDNWPIYKRYAQSPAPTVRFATYARTGGSWEPTIASVVAFTGVKDWVEPRGLKAFMDGSLGSRTAYMKEPFTTPLPGQKELRGVPMPGFVNGTYKKGIPLAMGSGLQVIVHAIGDEANHDILDLFEQAAPNPKPYRFRVEHVQHLLPEDIARFGRLGVIASMQPYHKADDGRYCDTVIGPERSRSSYTYHSLLATGAVLAFGSDWPVVTIDPFKGIETAVTGRILTGDIWQPQENISVDQALLSYTRKGAYAMRMEDRLGSIATGYLADFVILESSPWDDSVDWKKIRPAATYIGGRKAYP